jgi:hypothetical protein
VLPHEPRRLRVWLIFDVRQKMKSTRVFLGVGVLVTFAACGGKRPNEPIAHPFPAEVTLRELAAQETVAKAKEFAAKHDFRFIEQSMDTLRAQREQIPTYALGASGRIWVTFILQDPEATAHVWFYHDAKGYVLGTYVHVEPINK